MKFLPPLSLLAYVALGGSIGASLRFSISWALAHSSRLASWVPFAATTLVNVMGCFAVGWLFSSAYLHPTSPADAPFRAFLVIGVLGGFTTFSAFGYETLTLLQEEGTGAAGLYVALQLSLGVGAVILASKLS